MEFLAELEWVLQIQFNRETCEWSYYAMCQARGGASERGFSGSETNYGAILRTIRLDQAFN